MQKIFRVMIIIAMLITAYLLILAWRDDYADAPKQHNQTVQEPAAKVKKQDQSQTQHIFLNPQKCQNLQLHEQLEQLALIYQFAKQKTE